MLEILAILFVFITAIKSFSNLGKITTDIIIARGIVITTAFTMFLIVQPPITLVLSVILVTAERILEQITT